MEHKNSKKLYSIAIESWKYMRELNSEEHGRPNQELAPTKALKKWNRMQSQKVSEILNQPGNKNPFMASIHYESITLMLTKKKSISDFVAQD